jgi:hypothetical protein
MHNSWCSRALLLRAAAALLADLGPSADPEGGCPSPLRGVHIGGEDLSMFDGSGVGGELGAALTDGTEFLLEEPT